MKILFLTYFYYDIHLPILEEMKRQGHEVTVVEDKKIRHDGFSPKQNVVINLFRRAIRAICRTETKYWDNLFSGNPQIDTYYDVLVCQPGLSFCPFLLKRLRLHNPKIKSCVMIHDSANYYNYYHYKDLYDRVYTFDYEDAKRIPGVSVLGAYWVPTSKQPIEYDIVFVGSDHDDRYEIISKIYPQLENGGIKSKLRIVSLKPAYVKTKRSFACRVLRAEDYSKRLALWEEKIQQPFVVDKPLSIDEVNELINKSNCILETEREGQGGITLRDMWALATGKKIITTNSYLKNMPFYNSNQVRFIDRLNPVMDIAFIREHEDFPINELLIQQRIDNWVKRLLTF